MIEPTCQNIPYDFTLFEEDNTVDVSLFDSPIAAFDAMTPSSNKLMATPTASAAPVASVARVSQQQLSPSSGGKGFDGLSAALFGDLTGMSRTGASVGAYSAPTPANVLLDTPFTPFLETPSLDSPLDTPLPALEHDFGTSQLQQAQFILFDGLFPELSADPLAFGFLPEPKLNTVNPQSIFPDLFGSSCSSSSSGGAEVTAASVMTQQSQAPLLVDSLPLALLEMGEQQLSLSPATDTVALSDTSSLSSASSSPSLMSERDFDDDVEDWDYLPGSKRKAASSSSGAGASLLRPAKKQMLPCPIAPLSSRKPSNAPRRFECSFPGCDRRFARLYNLNTHEKTHDPSKARPFSCPACPKSFSRKHDLQRHVTGVHLGERNFACSTCDRTFSRHDGLRRHLSAPGPCYEAARVVT
ncbi:hypothetical protein DFQ26_000019 [Actinomortierella ambigua]|nr:hypothetical protein DFQ26_000019 [Actinomortierella ambigua]